MQTLEVYKHSRHYLSQKRGVAYHLIGTNLYWNEEDSTKGILEAFARLSAGVGWPRDASVGVLLKTYTSDSHPEHFI